jgi:competence protein ComEC
LRFWQERQVILIISFALSLRRKLINKYNTYLPDQDAAALASTLILGYRADLNKDVVEAYSKTGTMHVLSVSGMHVGIVFLVLSFLLRTMDKNKGLIVCTDPVNYYGNLVLLSD